MFHENNVNSFFALFSNIAICDLSETGRSKVELLFSIVEYSGIIRHIQKLSRDIQTHLEACVTSVYSEPIFRTLAYSELWYIRNPGIFRNLTYSESWHIQNTGIFRTRAIFRSLVYSGCEAYSQPCPT